MSTKLEPVHMPNHPFVVMLRSRRETNGYTLRSLCAKVGTTSRSYMAELEKGRFVPSFSVGLAICQVLDIPVNIYVNYYKSFHELRLQAVMEREYTEWFDSIPEEVAIRMMDGASSVHASLFNKAHLYTE